jgi:hypothetical protein
LLIEGLRGIRSKVVWWRVRGGIGVGGWLLWGVRSSDRNIGREDEGILGDGRPFPTIWKLRVSQDICRVGRLA